jgi:purine-binding chemotaxis protein CheW
MDDQEKIIIEVEENDIDEKESAKKSTLRVLSFSLGEENYCIHIPKVKEVIRLSDITRIPLAPSFAKGVINLRGEIVSVLDIREFFGLAQSEKITDPRIIITDAAGYSVGILADSIEGTIDIEEELIQEPLATLKQELRVYTKGQVQLGDKILIILDIEKVLNCEQIEKLGRIR